MAQDVLDQASGIAAPMVWKIPQRPGLKALGTTRHEPRLLWYAHFSFGSCGHSNLEVWLRGKVDVVDGGQFRLEPANSINWAFLHGVDSKRTLI